MATKDERSRKYDLILLGVTGYTGRYVAEELYRIQEEGKLSFSWAVAGRNETKVKEVLTGLGITGIDIIIADVNDLDSMKRMCGCGRVILDVVGPYVKYGESVIQACIDVRTDYVDITGETYFIESMLEKYGQEAKEAGVYIVNACGFDVIPNDIGSLVLQRAFNGELAYIESYVSGNAKGINTGTWESALGSIENYNKIKQLRKRRTDRVELPADKTPKRRTLFYSDITHKWCLPFPGADRACMLRSAEYRHLTEDLPMYRVKTYSSYGSLCQCIMLMLAFMVIIPLSMTKFGRGLLLKYPSFFTAGLVRKGGPSRSEVASGSFTVTLSGAGYSSDNTEKVKPDMFLKVKVRGAEPGYIATSAMMVQSALCLINERNKLPKDGGIFTPAAAFGNTNFVQNIEQTGKVKFTIEQ